jgi:hypothetical protein
VLRYIRSVDPKVVDPNDDPWNQSDATKAKIQKLVISGANYWYIHRLTFPAIDSNMFQRLLLSTGGETNIIINRILVEGMQPGFTNIYTGVGVLCCGAQNITIQNSVIRNSWGMLDYEPMGLDLKAGTNIHIVNNEVYDWSAHPIQMGRNDLPTMPGFVAENNDFYTTAWLHLPDGRARSKSPYSGKAIGTQTNPIRIIHNRIWGGRVQDGQTCCINGSGGHAMSIMGTGTLPPKWFIVQNNIFMESQIGVALLNGPGAQNISFVGNMFYGMRRFLSTYDTHALRPNPQMTNSEVYLNSFIDNEQYGFSFGGDVAIDVRCNAFMAGGARQGSEPGSSTVAVNNVFYGTPAWSFNSTGATIDKTLNIISGGLCTTLGCLATTDTTGKAVGDIVRTSATPATSCTAVNDQDCFLYKVVSVGSSGQVRAIRGPYVFYRKLRTKPELKIIHYARAYADPNNLQASADEAYACPADYAARLEMGVSNTN